MVVPEPSPSLSVSLLFISLNCQLSFKNYTIIYLVLKRLATSTIFLSSLKASDVFSRTVHKGKSICLSSSDPYLLYSSE